jgi:hypothetical protein
VQNNLFILLRSAIKNKSDYVRNGTHPKHNYRDKADPFTTSSKILAKYESDHLIRNIQKHAGMITNLDSFLYLSDGMSILSALEDLGSHMKEEDQDPQIN